MAGVFKTLTFLVLVFATTAVFAATEDYDVGDDADWMRPTTPQFYANWARGKTFRVGDELEFDFVAGRHDVAVVTKDAYDNCRKENPITLMTTPPVKIRLNATGPQYFICTIADHCTAGQKLSINVVSATGTGATPTPGPTPGAGGATPPGTTTPPGSSGTTTPPGSSGTTTPPGSSGTTTTTPPAGNDASSLGGATSLAVFVSAVVALFY